MTEVSLRELMEQRIDGVRTEIITRLNASDKAVILQLEAKEKALDLKSAEIERRLEMLNGEAGRLASILSKSVPREVWEQSQQGWNDWRAGVDKILATTAGRSAQTVYIIGLIIVAVQIALHFVAK
jgi:hypothetical protein